MKIGKFVLQLDVPQLKRGQVWCRACGFTCRVDSAVYLREGWPKHCGQTMTIDSPEEQAKFRAEESR